jgi:hypothetical protein
MDTGSFPQVKRSVSGVNHPLPSSPEVQERVELYLYSPCGLSWSVLEQTLTLFLITAPQISFLRKTVKLMKKLRFKIFIPDTQNL